MRNSLSYARLFFYAPALFRWSTYRTVLLREWIEPEQKDSTLCDVLWRQWSGSGQCLRGWQTKNFDSCASVGVRTQIHRPRVGEPPDPPLGVSSGTKYKVFINMRTRVKGNLLLCWSSETREKILWATENGRCVFVCIPKTVPPASASIMIATRRIEKFQYPTLGRSF